MVCRMRFRVHGCGGGGSDEQVVSEVKEEEKQRTKLEKGSSWKEGRKEKRAESGSEMWKVNEFEAAV